MRLLTLSMLAAFALGTAAPDAHAASYDNARRLTAAMGLESEISRAIGDAVSAVRAQLVAQGMAADKIDVFSSAFRDELEASAEGLITEMTRAYADRFSDAEVRELLDFYATPTGRKLVDIQHDLAAEQAQIVLRWIEGAAQRAAATISGAAGGSNV